MFRRKTLTSIIFITAIFALLMAAEVSAQSTYPEIWSDGNWEISVAVTVNEDPAWTKVEYTAKKLSRKAQDLSHWIVTAPADCIANLSTLNTNTTFNGSTGVTPPSEWQVAGTGDNSCGTGVGDTSIHVAKFEPLPVINRNESFSISIQIAGLAVGIGPSLVTIKPGSCISFFIGGFVCPPEEPPPPPLSNRKLSWIDNDTGNTIEITLDTNGNCESVKVLDPDGNTVDTLNCDDFVIGDNALCVRPFGSNTANSTINGDSNWHCGPMTFMSDGAAAQAENKLTCLYPGGIPICWDE